MLQVWIDEGGLEPSTQLTRYPKPDARFGGSMVSALLRGGPNPAPMLRSYFDTQMVRGGAAASALRTSAHAFGHALRMRMRFYHRRACAAVD